MNKKGFTTVELLVSFVLTSIIVFFLFEIIITLRNLYVSSGIKTKLLTKQSVLTENLNDDFATLDLIYAEKCDNSDADKDKEVCIYFNFSDVTKKLVVDREGNSITWGSTKNILVSGSEFGNIKISRENIVHVEDTKTLNGILTIDIPIYHHLIDGENFGIKINYQYNSNLVALGNLTTNDIVDSDKKIYVINEDDIKFKNHDYVDPGYYVVDKTNNTIITDANELAELVKVTGEVGNEVNETYYITYTIYDMNNNIMSQASRSVKVVESEYTFNLTESTVEQQIPIKGRYKIEAWGASGGGTTIMKGKGGYSSGIIELNTSDVLYVTVGGEGTTGLANTQADGGYNGGGNSGISAANYASSGGGASDIRLNSSSVSARIIVAGGGGGGGSRNDSEYSCSGGTGGIYSANGSSAGTCSSTSYLGGAGTLTSGGIAATYSDNVTTLATAGALGLGGNGASYRSGTTTTSGGGGGGGYYGGGGGSRYGGGGGGSSYCDSVNVECTTSSSLTFPAPDGVSYESGHIGDGYVKITLISIISN